MLYKLCRIKCNKRILLSLYFSIFQSHLTYGMCVWGNADFSLLQKLFLCQKRAIRIVADLEYRASTNKAFGELKLLKIDDLFKYNIAGVMWDHDHGILPTCFSNFFKNISDIHSYQSRSSAAHKLSENVIIHTKSHGESMLKFQGPKTLNELKNYSFYNLSKTKKRFQARYKEFLLDFY